MHRFSRRLFPTPYPRFAGLATCYLLITALPVELWVGDQLALDFWPTSAPPRQQQKVSRYNETYVIKESCDGGDNKPGCVGLDGYLQFLHDDALGLGTGTMETFLGSNLTSETVHLAENTSRLLYNLAQTSKNH